jgi:hypothetical protein
MENYEPKTNCNPTKEEMALDRPWKPWKQGRHGARLKDWLLTGHSRGISRMPYVPEGATGIKKKKKNGLHLY